MGIMTAKKKLYYAGYKLHCSECGDKSACWTIDPPTKGENLQDIANDAWSKQLAQVTEPAHKGHEWKFVKTLKYGSLKQLNDMEV